MARARGFARVGVKLISINVLLQAASGRFVNGWFWASLLLLGMPVYGVEIDLTRHLSTYSDGADENHKFVGVPGVARLIVESQSAVAVSAAVKSITLNGTNLLGGELAAGLVTTRDAVLDTGATQEIPVNLSQHNELQVVIGDNQDAQVSVRVKQLADVELHVQARVHFNTNVSDFAEARAFYGKLGFETVSEFPDANTRAMARAIGVTTPTSYDGSAGGEVGGYLLHGELVGPGGFGGGVIDLIEFTIPRNDSPPYERLNHLGMARATMVTTNIEADYQFMQEQGVRFISAPVVRSNGTKFAVFSDLDGTFYELAQYPSTDGDTDDDDAGPTHIVSLGQVNINVSDFERSKAWYEMLGYRLSTYSSTTESPVVAQALGINESFERTGATFMHSEDESTLEIVQWHKPYDAQPAYSLPVNHLGIHRMAFLTSDIETDVAVLREQGVQFVSDITPCCSGPDAWGSIVAFYDPDGVVVELVEQPFMSPILSVMSWFGKLFD